MPAPGSSSAVIAARYRRNASMPAEQNPPRGYSPAADTAVAGDPARTGVRAAVDEEALPIGGHERGSAGELGMLAPRRGEPRGQLVDQRLGLRRAADRLADQQRLLLPGDAVVGHSLRRCDRRRQ